MDGLKRFVQTDPWKWCRDDTFKPHRERESNLSFFGGFSDFRYYDSKQFRRFCQHSTSFLRVFSSKQVECSANPAQVFCKRSASVSPDSSTSQQYSSELLSRQKLPRIFLPLVTSLFVADRFFFHRSDRNRGIENGISFHPGHTQIFLQFRRFPYIFDEIREARNDKIY